MSAFATWDAVETRRLIGRREVSAREVTEAAIARAEEAGHLGGMVAPMFERALATADALDEKAPLAGVPTFIKDLAQVRGAPTAWGSMAAGRYVSRKSDSFVKRFEATGVITLGKSATPELGLTATTEPLGQPPCRNPWDRARSSGGSSGGAGCLVAAGVVPIAHGSDGGGSIRVPAACCGLVGLKPSRFRSDLEGSNLLPVNIASDGVLTRTVRDTVAFYGALEARGAPRKVPPIGEVGDRPAQPLRIGAFVEAPGGTPVDPEVREAVRAAARTCHSLGHYVDEIACPVAGSVIDDFLTYWGFVAWLQVRSAWWTVHWGFDRKKIEPWTRGLAESFSRNKRAAFAATGRLRRFSRSFSTVLTHHDVLLSPTVAEPAPPLGYLATNLPYDVNRARLRSYVAFTPIYNAAGAPAISLPLGRSKGGLPIGVQFAAAPGQDRTLLELARSIETLTPWLGLAPRRNQPESTSPGR